LGPVVFARYQTHHR
jgi:hypothetical protein